MLTNLASFKGVFSLTPALASVLKMDLGALKSGKPANATDEEWATAIAIAALETRFSEFKIEWTLLATKARKSLNEKAEELVVAATKIVQ